MTDLALQIRARLDGWAPPATGEAPPQFLEVTDPGMMTPQQVEAWQQAWDELLATSAQMRTQVIATQPRFYPGFEQMRAALLAAVQVTNDLQPWNESDWSQGFRECCRQVRLIIADKLGIEADGG